MSESKRPRGKYKTTNWASYNASLKARGSLTVWLDKDLQWYAPATGKRGRQPICRIPDDCIDKNRYPLFMARSVLRELIESLPSTRSL